MTLSLIIVYIYLKQFTQNSKLFVALIKLGNDKYQGCIEFSSGGNL